MVHFKDWKAGAAPPQRAPAHRPVRHTEMMPPLQLELRPDHGAAYLQLLSQLAQCGIDAAGPPLLHGGRSG